MIGTRLGIYEITAKLGEGGMGEVYRAHDTKLGRDVALKVLPQGITTDPERLARFEREARVLASLNHPNIGAIYGLEEAGESQALVLELIEGPTLAERIAQGPMALDDALGIARQIAEALETAHEQGVVHRDLKPANVKVRADGTVKVLDFGLAKALDRPGDQVSSSVSMSPTLTAMTGQAGTILGTAAYMSPEQARGDAVDRRADIWAFGVVLFEMLSGRRPFEGRTVSDTLASVLARDPDFERLPSDVPEAVRRLLRRCLEKDDSKRLRDVVDGMHQLEEDLAAPALPGPASQHQGELAAWQNPRTAAALALAVFAAGALLAWSVTRTPPPVPRIERFDVSPRLPVSVGLAGTDHDIAITPDGGRVIYTTGPHGSPTQLHVRDVESLETRPLLQNWQGSAFAPFVSPDGAWVGFSDEDDENGVDGLKKVSIAGGPATTICPVVGNGIDGASWSPNGDDIVFGSSARSGLWRVPAAGGDAEEITSLDRDAGELNHGWPHFLPDGRHLLFTVEVGSLNEARIQLLDLDSGERRALLEGGTFPRYASSGHLLYAAQGSIWAVRFDADRLEITDREPVRVIDGVMHKGSGAANLDLSKEGSLVYVRAVADAEPMKSLVWVDLEGREEPIAMPSLNYDEVGLSPSGQYLAAIEDDRDSNTLWIHDLERGTETVLARDVLAGVLFTPDSRSLIYTARRDNEILLVRKRIDSRDAEERLLVASPDVLFLRMTGWAEEGRSLIGTRRFGAGSFDVVTIRLDEPSGGERRLVSLGGGIDPSLSSSGAWLAYVSNRSDRAEVYVQRFPSQDDDQIVSTAGGLEPHWSADGREIFYRSSEGLMRVAVLETSPTLRLGAPQEVFDVAPYYYSGRRSSYAASGDGRFVMIREPEGAAEAPPPEVVLVRNWAVELERSSER